MPDDLTPFEHLEELVVDSDLKPFYDFFQQVPPAHKLLEKAIVLPLGEQLDDEREGSVGGAGILELIE